MKIRAALVCTLLLGVPGLASAQYVERWAIFGSLGLATSLAPGNVGNFDNDPDLEIAISEGQSATTHRVQVRHAITGAVEFTSGTSSQSNGQWTIYVLNLDSDSPLEILACDGERVMVIDYSGALAVQSDESQAMLPALRHSRPNPFAGGTTLSFALPAPGSAEIEIFDVAGRMVRRLGGERRAAGEHEMSWDGRDQSGKALQPGMYLYRLNVDGRVSEARKTIQLGQ